MQLAPLHTADELRRISNLAHLIEGVVLGAAALVALAQATGRFDTGPARLLWPGLIVAAGVGLLFYLIVPHHGISHARIQWSFVFGDPQQRQHIVIAIVMVLAGVAELLTRSSRVTAHAWSFAWPAALFLVGTLFVVHPQHGTKAAILRATLVHRWLGAVLIGAGLLAGIDALRSRREGVLSVAWAVMLLVAAGLLMIYREPAGAYHEAMQ